MKGGFWSMEHRPPPHPRDTQLPFDMLSITMLYTCHVTEVVYHGGRAASFKKKIKILYSLIKKSNERHKNLVE